MKMIHRGVINIMERKKTKEELAKLQSLDMVEYFKKVTAKKMELEKNTAKHLSEKWEYREMKTSRKRAIRHKRNNGRY